ncbi:MAG: hypothetical protein SOV16_00450 [Anaerobiospirillum succiniciproducens]|uniref:hypothetical protein n=1 Tax=Anaerobiospirillum succiniciproducens TaxID=13335 RepID=UPI002A747D3A|nr:hypothetical protein [Anaerobiospirillum succiniciproducens]MDY2797651.1 hypothetical protein [Anaerobiospirillum succiniciproducens]
MKSQGQTLEYINKLAKFGPSLNNSNSFAESQGDDRFDFEVSCCIDYVEAMHAIVERDQPTVVVVNGQAGDGKTHLILDFLFKKYGVKLKFNINDSSYRELVELNESRNNSSDKNCSVWLVSDCSELADKSQDKKMLLEDIISILSPESSENRGSKIIILAANKGILLQYFEEISEAIKSRSESHDDFDKLYLNPLRSYFLGDASSCQYEDFICSLSVRDSKLKRDAKEKLFLLDMSSIVDTHLLYRIIDELYADKHFHDCDSCDSKAQCPINHNLKILKQDNCRFKYGLAALIMILIANGAHINIRKILIILSNALLGRWKDKAPLMNCHEIKSITNVNKIEHEYNYFDYKTEGMKSDLDNSAIVIYSNPYDNLFGLNLILSYDKKSALDADISKVFQQLLSTGLGFVSNITIDNFLAKVEARDAKDESSPYFKIASYFYSIKEGEDNYVDKAFHSLKAALNTIRRESDEFKKQNDGEKSIGKNHHIDHLNILESLRRCFFFTMHDELYVRDSSNSRLFECNNALDDLYCLSSFRHGLQFLELWTTLQNFDSNDKKCRDYINNYAKKLGFKNISTGLKALFSDSHDIDHNNDANKIKIYFYCKTSEIQQSHLLNDSCSVDLDTRYYKADEGFWTVIPDLSLLRLPMVQAGSPTISLVITPDIYEALAGLGAGELSINFASQCIAELEIFREKLTSQVLETHGNSNKLNEIIPMQC